MCPTMTSTAALSNWSPATFVPGPVWRSFERFRLSGPIGLDQISIGSIGTIHIKSNTFRVLRDEDFQKLLGLASEVHRLKSGLTFVLTAAKVVAKYPKDPDSIELLCRSVSFLSESSVLPERDGHGMFQITSEEAHEYGKEELDLSTFPITRPKL